MGIFGPGLGRLGYRVRGLWNYGLRVAGFSHLGCQVGFLVLPIVSIVVPFFG